MEPASKSQSTTARRPAERPTLPEEVEALERQRIAEAMAETGWVQSQAARRLGLTARQLGYKLRKYGIEQQY